LLKEKSKQVNQYAHREGRKSEGNATHLWDKKNAADIMAKPKAEQKNYKEGIEEAFLMSFGLLRREDVETGGRKAKRELQGRRYTDERELKEEKYLGGKP